MTTNRIDAQMLVGTPQELALQLDKGVIKPMLDTLAEHQRGDLAALEFITALATCLMVRMYERCGPYRAIALAKAQINKAEELVALSDERAVH